MYARTHACQVDEFLPLVDSSLHPLYRAVAAWEGAYKEGGREEL